MTMEVEVAARRLAERVIRQSFLADPRRHAEMQEFAREHNCSCPRLMTEAEIKEYIDDHWVEYLRAVADLA